MPENTRQSTEDKTTGTAKPSYQDLVRQVADQVWKLWKKELTQERERRGLPRGK